MSDLYLNVQASLFNLCREMISVIEGLGIGNLDIINWDAHATLKELPMTDLLGPSSSQIEIVNRQLIEVTTRIALSTYQDTNNARLDKMLNVILGFVIPDKTFNLVHHTTPGSVIGLMKVLDGTMVEPVMRSDIRNLKALWFRAGSDQAIS